MFLPRGGFTLLMFILRVNFAGRKAVNSYHVPKGSCVMVNKYFLVNCWKIFSAAVCLAPGQRTAMQDYGAHPWQSWFQLA